MLPSAAASLQLSASSSGAAAVSLPVSASSSCGAACWPSMRHLHQLQHLRRAVKASGAAHLNLVFYSKRNAVHGSLSKVLLSCRVVARILTAAKLPSTRHIWQQPYTSHTLHKRSTLCLTWRMSPVLLQPHSRKKQRHPGSDLCGGWHSRHNFSPASCWCAWRRRGWLGLLLSPCRG